MVKTRTNVSIEPYLLEQAKDKNINISETLENSLKKELEIAYLEDANKDCCIVCGIPIVKPHLVIDRGSYFEHYCKKHERFAK